MDLHQGPKIKKEGVEFAQNCVAIINEGKLAALWLKPIIITKSIES